MTDKEKVLKSIEIINEADIKDEQISADEIYEIMKDIRFIDVAEEIAEFVALFNELRHVLES